MLFFAITIPLAVASIAIVAKIITTLDDYIDPHDWEDIFDEQYEDWEDDGE